MARTNFPSDKQDQFMVRMPDGMRDKLKAEAAANKRSLNAEIVSKLERYDSLGGEVDALDVVARAIASGIDEAFGGDPGLLYDKVRDVYDAVDESGNVDRERLHREWTADVSRRLRNGLEGTVHLPDELLARIKAKAAKNLQSVQAEILATLEREYPAPADVMHIHLENIRRALDQYERETDPQARMRLQTLVEMMVTSGHNVEVDFDEDED